MFDLVTGRVAHIPSRPGGPVLVSAVLQTAVIAVLATVSMLLVSERLPEVPAMMAFVVDAPPPSPPPPPPPPPARAPAPVRDTTPSRQPEPELVVPAIVPVAVEPDVPVEPIATDIAGIEGGVPEGVPGGVVGGVVPDVPLPPPPPEPPREPVRAGGRIESPELLRRVRPEYPNAAVQARIQGTVILDALVDEQGRVVDVTVLRSAHSTLDRAAITAVRQWQYAPLLLNGTPHRFRLTVTLAFGLDG